MDAAFVAAQQQRIGEILAPPRLDLPRRIAPLDRMAGLELLKEEQALRLRYRIPNADAGALTIDTNLFPYDPLHQTFINVYEEGELRQQADLQRRSRTRTSTTAARRRAHRGDADVHPVGHASHPDRPDHILFLIGLLLLGRSWGALVTIVTAFTIGHSITLSLAALDVVTPPASIIEPAIALSIVFVGADNLVQGRRPRPARVGGARLRPRARLRVRQRAARVWPAARGARLVALLVQLRRRDRPARRSCCSSRACSRRSAGATSCWDRAWRSPDRSW